MLGVCYCARMFASMPGSFWTIFEVSGLNCVTKVFWRLSQCVTVPDGTELFEQTVVVCIALHVMAYSCG